MDILRIEGIKKSFKNDISFERKEILHGVSFFARKGEILGFLGPNGAGKTTTIKIILGLMRPDEGTVSIFGRSSRERSLKARIGYLPENPYFYPHLNLREFLTFCGNLSGMRGKVLDRKVAATISLVDLEASHKQRLKSFSKGMLQRAGLAQAILHDPDLLILDEPFSGLDPLGRKIIRDILLGLRRRGKTIFFSSHILPDMEALCNRACLIRSGKVVKNIGLDEIFRLGEGKVEVVARGFEKEIFEMMRDLIDKVEMNGEEFFLSVSKQEYVRAVVQHIYNSGGEILRVVNQHPSLEDIFMNEISGTGGEGEDSRRVEEKEFSGSGRGKS
ncbi:MAG: ABC transporter ATP-binding protein [Candidatus Krumholzibacteriota bacterium]|nr:ABC transporter ATP-binding protein [Candidatus Krumholzibacteriota bacterium]